LIYHFTQPEYSHRDEKPRLKTGKIPHGANEKAASADRRVFGTAGRRETSIHFYSSEGRAEESVELSFGSARRQADHLIRSGANQQQERAMGSCGTEENGATESTRDRQCFWNKWNRDK